MNPADPSPPDAALRAIGWPFDGAPSGLWAEVMATHAQALPMRVVEQHRSGYLVAGAPGEAIAVESLPDWLRRSGYRKGTIAPEDRAAVGDWVLVEDGKRIVAMLPRRSAIKRAAAGEHYKQQLIAANIDTVLVVCGLDADFNPRRIERYLLLVQGGGTPVIVLTKADKPEADIAAAVAALTEIAGLGVAVVPVNARDHDSAAVLHRWLGPGMTAVLVGSSGAGKSTLTNSLLGVERMKTAAVRETDDRGRHTTTHRALIPLPSGACLIDTPGMRELKPTGEEDLSEGGFADVEAVAAQCRFRDCTHGDEPGCAVWEAVDAGTLDPGRLGSYLKLRDELAGAAGQLATRMAQKVESRPSGKKPGAKTGGRPGVKPAKRGSDWTKEE
ncbi:ribosome small subunit-dependent GTPase A [Luteimonas fraxinea]|uniref:Small ribosomal subunit biogenesis GTPase RsgA n=1 Tax=Luteimonas fraxinea TaxID=2901869 RepID=A0ABS8U694_9GAMM|nr:ribosome small subunit-dependent GTPase A [Luteimonas fraxinea]MCD9095333.1 ribosome small subunit-dependent GTPase A [Luteimonas fraxinea]UHH11452.1 ribosome small subunit-dependent GTPase A [Luteimonas fraxinea]